MLTDKIGYLNGLTPFPVVKYKKKLIFVGMDEKICKICDINKSIDEYHYRLGVRVDYCKSCLLDRRARLDDYGINLPIEEQTSQTKYFIRGARELLTNMGYDLNLPIYLQFKERLRVKYGKDMF